MERPRTQNTHLAGHLQQFRKTPPIDIRRGPPHLLLVNFQGTLSFPLHTVEEHPLKNAPAHHDAAFPRADRANLLCLPPVIFQLLAKGRVPDEPELLENRGLALPTERVHHSSGLGYWDFWIECLHRSDVDIVRQARVCRQFVNLLGNFNAPPTGTGPRAPTAEAAKRDQLVKNVGLVSTDVESPCHFFTSDFVELRFGEKSGAQKSQVSGQH